MPPAPADAEGYGSKRRAGGVAASPQAAGFSSGCRGGSRNCVRASLLPPRPPPLHRLAWLSLRPQLCLPARLGLHLRVGFPLSLEAPNMNRIVCAGRHQVRRDPAGCGWRGGGQRPGLPGPAPPRPSRSLFPVRRWGCGRGAPACPPLSCPLGWRNRILCGSAALGCSFLPDLQVAGLTKAKSWPWPVPSRSPGDVGALPGVSSGPGNEVFPPRVGVVRGGPLLKPL